MQYWHFSDETEKILKEIPEALNGSKRSSRMAQFLNAFSLNMEEVHDVYGQFKRGLDIDVVDLDEPWYLHRASFTPGQIRVGVADSASGDTSPLSEVYTREDLFDAPVRALNASEDTLQLSEATSISGFYLTEGYLFASDSVNGNTYTYIIEQTATPATDTLTTSVLNLDRYEDMGAVNITGYEVNITDTHGYLPMPATEYPITVKDHANREFTNFTVDASDNLIGFIGTPGKDFPMKVYVTYRMRIGTQPAGLSTIPYSIYPNATFGSRDTAGMAYDKERSINWVIDTETMSLRGFKNNNNREVFRQTSQLVYFNSYTGTFTLDHADVQELEIGGIDHGYSVNSSTGVLTNSSLDINTNLHCWYTYRMDVSNWTTIRGMEYRRNHLYFVGYRDGTWYLVDINLNREDPIANAIETAIPVTDPWGVAIDDFGYFWFSSGDTLTRCTAKYNVFMKDTDHGFVYLRDSYTTFLWNGAAKTTQYHPILTKLDDFGVMTGQKRRIRENNVSLRRRILDSLQNPGNSTKQGLIDTISRELGLETYQATARRYYETTFMPEDESAMTVYDNWNILPTWHFAVEDKTIEFAAGVEPSGPVLSASYTYWDGWRSKSFVDIWSGTNEVWTSTTPTNSQVQINSLNDTTYMDSIMPSGTATGTKMESFATQLRAKVADRYEDMVWDRSYFEDDAMSDRMKYADAELPHVWDPYTTGLSGSDWMSGTGDEPDLIPRLTVLQSGA